jgi:ABC-type phosphate transport system substrate-binding protein
MKLPHFLYLGFALVCTNAVSSEFVVVVNKGNNIEALSKREVIDIYMGRYLTFPDGESAQPLDLPAQSQLKNDFYLKLVNQDERKINAYWARLLFSGRAKPPETVKSVDEVLQKLQTSEFSIAYIPASELTDNVKVVYRLNEN